jgi:gliding motility-associated-like protein
MSLLILLLLLTPAAPVVAGEVTQPTCDVATGSFSITAVDGMEYSFNGGAFGNTTSWSDLAAGDYTVVARNDDGCESAALTVTIDVQPATPAAPVVAGEVTQPTCDVATGSFSITAVDGMEYSFNGGAFGNTTSWSDLAAGDYTVVARNDDGCESAALTVTIDVQPATPAAPVVAGEVTQPTCDVATGSFSITAVDGMEYSFNGGAFGNTTSWSDLAAGDYTVVARNDDGCESAALTVTIDVQPATPAAPVVAGEVTQPTCDVATGSFSITAVDGMEYSFNGGAFGNTTSWSDLAAGDYTVVARNDDGCESAALTVTIDVQPATPAAPVVAGEVTQPTCDVATGSFSITAVDGMEYSFNGGAFGNTTSWSDLAAGDYTVVARNDDGCESAALTVTIDVQPATPAAPVVAGEVTQPTCDVATGSFSITAVDGMEYSFNGGAFGNTTSWSDLAAGDYTVVARNDDGCESAALTVTIDVQPATPAAPVVAGEVTQPTCDVATGSFSITAVDGMEYSFNGGAFGNTTSWSDLAAGDYTVVARNDDGCESAALTVTIDVQPATPAAPVVAGEVTQPTCDVATGSFSITAVDGMEYSFNGGAFGNTTSWSDLAAGDYTVVARNDDGCESAALTVTIDVQPATPAAPVVAGEVTQPTCDVATGSFSITAVDGMEYSFNGGAFGNTTSWSDLAAGDYTVVARNDDGCESAALTVTIDVQPATPAAPVVAGEVTQPTCDVATGSFSITAVEGLQYSLNGGAYASTTTFEGLSAGTYTVTARSASGCVSAATSVTINAVQELAAPVIASTVQPGCESETGSFTVVSETGVSYSINGTDYQTSVQFTGLTPGSYNVTARNETGCVSAATVVVIEEAEENTPTVIGTEDLCNGNPENQGDEPFDLFELLGGNYSRTGTWEDPAQTGALTGSIIDPARLDVGNYTFNYVIGGSCPSTTVVAVSINDLCVVLAPCTRADIIDGISKVVTPNGDTYNDFFTIDVDNELECDYTYNVKIFNRWGSEVFAQNNYRNNWDGQSNRSVTSSNQLPSGTYYYIVEINGSPFEPIQGYIFLGTK